MRRVDDYRQNAQACRDLAREMPPAVRDHLLEMAKEWDRFAEDRERHLKDVPEDGS
jgi:hypothetical protein